MTFIFTSWYFVMIALVAGIIACIAIFISMDKKDRAMIKKYVEENQQQAKTEHQNQNAVSSEQNNN